MDIMSDIPPGEKDLDDAISFKDKIKALDNKLIIQPSPDKRKSQLTVDQPGSRLSQHSPDTANKRKSQNDVNMVNSITGLPKQPKIVVSEEEDVKTKDRDTSRSAGDNVSKSDTQDDISDKIFDNLSMHSSTSQPFNPDVVIADSDDEDEFAEIQRGTVILKSFQRAKPPRNRSPATRTSKGKIRKPRPNAARKQGDKQDDREPTSTPSSASVPFSMATSDSKTNSLEKSETKVQNNTSKNNSLEKLNERKKSIENNVESPMTKSSNFSDFDSIMSQSITSIGSDIVTPMKRETGKNGKYAKRKDSPKRERKESPVRVMKSKEREITEKEKRNESPNRFKKSKDSPVEKRKNKRKDDDRLQNRLSTDISEDKAVTNSNAENRLSGIPANASNNIFYLIDPTVKDKCKSVGDVTGDKRKSGDYSRHAQKAAKHKTDDNQSKQNDDSLSAVKRERTLSDPNRKSAELKTNTR
ncbi:pre-mRNA-splicing factor CWC22 homolog isoform X2 [Mercenaria mercenaria]|uniref:pre-mRNA-splicing factor CWC22 homolog isoform X2 n=1 Tax=Mercenaria mercenaria TaxID=6596 RepID=UPI00234F21EA|nr:pre-mRNA-splicing factor CWC22 homolog isoform X2 [Mercenaria mercenaria]